MLNYVQGPQLFYDATDPNPNPNPNHTTKQHAIVNIPLSNVYR